jgi:hypothetical protein
VRALRTRTTTPTPGPWFDRGADDSHAMSAFYVTTNSGRSHDLDGLGGDEDAGDVVAITLLQRPGLAYIADERWEENAAYIAAFHPATALALLDRLEALEAALRDAVIVLDGLTAEGLLSLSAQERAAQSLDLARAALEREEAGE